MAPNVQIADRLLNQARKIGGFRTKKETVTAALVELVRRRAQREIGTRFGTVDFTPGFDEEKLRAGR